jgi:hypothetical protein
MSSLSVEPVDQDAIPTENQEIILSETPNTSR